LVGDPEVHEAVPRRGNFKAFDFDLTGEGSPPSTASTSAGVQGRSARHHPRELRPADSRSLILRSTWSADSSDMI